MGNSSSKAAMGTLPKDLNLPDQFEVWMDSSLKSNLRLAVSWDEVLYTVALRKLWMGSLELYRGDEPTGPCLATVENTSIVKSKYQLTLPGGQTISIEPHRKLSEGFRFSVDEGTFSWHSASRDELRGLDEATVGGMKLTRDDSGEVVALWTHPEWKAKSLHKAAVFAFVGSALKGEFGVDFTTAAVMSFINIFRIRILTITTTVT